MLIHSFEVVFIHKPRARFIIYTSYFSFNPVAVKDEVFLIAVIVFISAITVRL